MTLHSSPMGRGGHRDDRRRRLLAEDLTANSGLPAQGISATLPRNGQPPAHKSENYGDAEFLQTQLRLTDLIPRRLISYLLLLKVGLAAIGGLMALYVWIPGPASRRRRFGRQWLIWAIAEVWETGSLPCCFSPPACWRSSFTVSADIKLTIIVDIITYGSGRPLAGLSWRPTWPPVFTRAFSK